LKKRSLENMFLTFSTAYILVGVDCARDDQLSHYPILN